MDDICNSRVSFFILENFKHFVFFLSMSFLFSDIYVGKYSVLMVATIIMFYLQAKTRKFFLLYILELKIFIFHKKNSP